MKKWLKIINLIVVFIFVLGAAARPSDKDKKPAEIIVSPSPNQAVEGISATSVPTVTPFLGKIKYKVVRVIDGDTLEIENKIKVRLIGIDAPEAKNNECYQQESTNFLKSLIENQEIGLEKDVSETDRYGRLLRYIYKDGIMINEKLVSEGYAYVSSYPPDIKYQVRFKEAQSSARFNKRGLWNSCKL